MTARHDYPMVERGAPQWEAMVDEIDALRRANEAMSVRPIVLTGFPALLGKGDRFYDASVGATWRVFSVDRGVVWMPEAQSEPEPEPTQEVTMQPITDTRFTDTRFTVDTLTLRDDSKVSVAVHDATVESVIGNYVSGFSFSVPIEMAPRIGEVITLSWGGPS